MPDKHQLLCLHAHLLPGSVRNINQWENIIIILYNTKMFST